MLGIEVAESTVGRYMVRRRRPPSQGWKTFLRNHAAGIASLDLFVVRTISFKLLYGLVILHHARRRDDSLDEGNPLWYYPHMSRFTSSFWVLAQALCAASPLGLLGLCGSNGQALASIGLQAASTCSALASLSASSASTLLYTEEG
jgi:hypothetical protein